MPHHPARGPDAQRLGAEDMHFYMQKFADTFLRDRISYNTEVVNIKRPTPPFSSDPPNWIVTVRDNKTGNVTERGYDRVVLCTGVRCFHSYCRYPVLCFDLIGLSWTSYTSCLLCWNSSCCRFSWYCCSFNGFSEKFGRYLERSKTLWRRCTRGNCSHWWRKVCSRYCCLSCQWRSTFGCLNGIWEDRRLCRIIYSITKFHAEKPVSLVESRWHLRVTDEFRAVSLAFSARTLNWGVVSSERIWLSSESESDIWHEDVSCIRPG